MVDYVSETCTQCIQLLGAVPPSIFILSILTTFVGSVVFPFKVYLFLFAVAFKPRKPFDLEKRYRILTENDEVSLLQELPCWLDTWERERKQKPNSKRDVDVEKPELFMSVVIPAYNEEERLVGMLEETVEYLESAYGVESSHETKNKKNTVTKRTRKDNAHQSNGHVKQTDPTKGWEILIVSDGSTDRTEDVAFNFARKHDIPVDNFRVIVLSQNRGKGGAVTHGMRHVRGQYVVFADADGASKFADLGKLVQACQKVEDSNGRAVAVGSRAHMVGSEAVVKRSKLRNFLMHSFHLILWLLTPSATAKIGDTQCGFKLFSRASLPFIIPYMHSEGWIFDVEMLMLAEFSQIPVAEVPVGWREVKGSKLNVVWDSIGMAWGLFVLRASWSLGVYRRT
ncbi:putative dolichyl-phosphate beta-glucosyltransferase [Talaromyces proteolyticus]|uniref:dolichyl-phosphate beta-glucosyltransferase n=1 Tax=Talaromyces proteolyticus TaxID=1131652 RepID=A0AAD4KW82_9EURO|nr:putative dolichyl-phosphate beta-glucosyltransferase [Talaromyces proteolyticus]KAH8702357.1 putative dolichyl-phosphate beta-glucosyltransferase [Talaromyces proteolyticus]